MNYCTFSLETAEQEFSNRSLTRPLTEEIFFSCGDMMKHGDNFFR